VVNVESDLDEPGQELGPESVAPLIPDNNAVFVINNPLLSYTPLFANLLTFAKTYVPVELSRRIKAITVLLPKQIYTTN
jgi:hypothetical protein